MSHLEEEINEIKFDLAAAKAVLTDVVSSSSIYLEIFDVNSREVKPFSLVELDKIVSQKMFYRLLLGDDSTGLMIDLYNIEDNIHHNARYWTINVFMHFCVKIPEFLLQKYDLRNAIENMNSGELKEVEQLENLKEDAIDQNFRYDPKDLGEIRQADALQDLSIAFPDIQIYGDDGVIDLHEIKDDQFNFMNFPENSGILFCISNEYLIRLLKRSNPDRKIPNWLWYKYGFNLMVTEMLSDIRSRIENRFNVLLSPD